MHYDVGYRNWSTPEGCRSAGISQAHDHIPVLDVWMLPSFCPVLQGYILHSFPICWFAADIIRNWIWCINTTLISEGDYYYVERRKIKWLYFGYIIVFLIKMVRLFWNYIQIKIGTMVIHRNFLINSLKMDKCVSLRIHQMTTNTKEDKIIYWKHVYGKNVK